MSDFNIGLLLGFISGLGAILGRDLLLWQQARRLNALRKCQRDQTHPGC